MAIDAEGRPLHPSYSNEGKESEKTVQQINNEIPLNIWDDFEDLYTMEKRKDPSRKLHKKDFFIQVFKKGVSGWKD